MSLSAILYLSLPYSCLHYNRQFFIPVSLRGEKKKKPLLRSNPVNAKIRLWAVAYCTATICVRESLRGVVRRIKRGNKDKISEKIMADKKLNAFRGGKKAPHHESSQTEHPHTD